MIFENKNLMLKSDSSDTLDEDDLLFQVANLFKP
jgi:hypothetical protein